MLQKFIFTVCCCCLFFTSAMGQSNYQKDFDFFLQTIQENYAYLEQQQISVEKIKTTYSPLVSKIENKADFIRLLEKVFNEFYNGHNSLNTNLSTSNRLVPSGADIVVEQKNKQYFVKDVKPLYGCDLVGLKVGMEIVKFNNNPIAEQLLQFLPQTTPTHTPTMYDYAIAMLFAGTHQQARKITAIENGVAKDFFPESVRKKEYPQLLLYQQLDKNTGYIKINNSLYNNDLIAEFDKVLDSLMTTQQLIIDLTNTPSGGNTTVARAIMGRFIDSLQPYQRHEFDEQLFGTQRHWVEYVKPRKATYKGKVAVLVGYWTGSMGEGLAVGFDGMQRATVIGTRMARLIGAINGFELPNTKIGFQIPTERLYHINGIAREQYLPTILTNNYAETLRKVQELFKLSPIKTW